MFDNEKFNQLNSRINYNDDQKLINITNHSFQIIVEACNEKLLKRNHIPFTFSYLYLQSYLFRYTKYDYYVPYVSEIKEILTYDGSNKTLNYIIKYDGLLDQINLTKTIYDFPIFHEWVNNNLSITLLSHLNNSNQFGKTWRNDKGINYNASCKYPVTAFYDDLKLFDEITVNDNGGTFFNSSNSTLIDWNIFNYCMSNNELGCTGFYLHSFIKSQQDKLGSCMLGFNKLSTYTGLSTTTLTRYIKSLRQYNLIECVSGTFVVGADKVKGEVKKESNVYFANKYEDIKGVKVELDKPKFISLTHYLEKKKLEDDTINNQIVDPIFEAIL